MKDLIDDRERRSDTAAATNAREDRYLCIIGSAVEHSGRCGSYRYLDRQLCRNLYEEHDLKSGVHLEADLES